MRSLVSASGGICVLVGPGGPQFVDIAAMRPVSTHTAHFLCSTLSDWKEIDARTDGLVLAAAQERHHLARVVTNLETCLSGAFPELQYDLFLEVEDLLKSGVSSSEAVAEMLRAPLRDMETVTRASSDCAVLGNVATSSLLERVRDAQPLLRRLTDYWLALPDSLFSSASVERQSFWRLAVRHGVILKTLDARDGSAVRDAWAGLVFYARNATQRLSIAAVAAALAGCMFPEYTSSIAPSSGPKVAPGK